MCVLGGMTEEKKVLRRKVLAKWLKENILRLGPTFIKIGQQFSTRVDILPQEYVDQLSELQVCFLLNPSPSERSISACVAILGCLSYACRIKFLHSLLLQLYRLSKRSLEDLLMTSSTVLIMNL